MVGLIGIIVRRLGLLRFAALVLACLVVGGCARPFNTEPENSREKSNRVLPLIGDVRGDGPPRWFDPRRLNLRDAAPRLLERSSTGNAPYVISGRKFVPLKSGAGYRATGMASWYGRKFHGRRTSSGEPYDMFQMSAAHRILPLPSFARITNLDSGAVVVVKVNDRGPFRDDRIVDLSYAAAVKLGADKTGTVRVRLEAIDPLASGTRSSQALSKTTQELPTVAPLVAKWTPADADHSLKAPADASLDAAKERARVAPGGRIYLQLGAFGNYDNAARLKTRLMADGLKHVFISTLSRAGGDLHRVRIGPYTDAEAAGDVKLRVQRQFNTAAEPVFDR